MGGGMGVDSDSGGRQTQEEAAEIVLGTGKQ